MSPKTSYNETISFWFVKSPVDQISLWNRFQGQFIVHSS